EFAFARAEPGEVEAQRGDAERGKPLGDALGGVDVLAAGEAMSEQRVGARLTGGTIEQRGKLLSLGVGKIEALCRHARLLHVLQAEAQLPPGAKLLSVRAPRNPTD